MGNYLKENGLFALMILISLVVSGLFFWAIDYSIHNDLLEVRTNTLGYIITSLILGFLVVWFTYISIEWLIKRKKKKMWPW